MTYMYETLNWIINGSHSVNGLLPIQQRTINWINVNSLLIGLLETSLHEISIKISKFCFKKMHLKCHLQNVVRFFQAPMCSYPHAKITNH